MNVADLLRLVVVVALAVVGVLLAFTDSLGIRDGLGWIALALAVWAAIGGVWIRRA